MQKLKSYDEFKNLVDELKSKPKTKFEIRVCGGAGCHSSGANSLIENLSAELAKRGLAEDVKITPVGCFGFCEAGPLVQVSGFGIQDSGTADETFYVKVEPEHIERIVEEHIIGGKPVEDLLYTSPKTNLKQKTRDELDFYKGQKKIALEACGVVNPEIIEESIALGAYSALAKCLFELQSADINNVVKDSGLRGRGGGGFPTGLKWELTAKEVSDKKYVVCNADEGDPGAFMDRSIMEGDPHSVIEAMAICGRAIGADEGIVYIRAEYPLAMQRLEIAIEQAKSMGLLGENILGTGFNFDIHLNVGAGAFVCGEETSLMNSVQGERGEPRIKPPFPAQKGVWDKPTVINNVETFANIPRIILGGAEWFKSIGTEKSKGTKVFALAGKINNVGLTEVPMGTTLREVIYGIGGGIVGGKAFKAVQTGGPSGGCIPAEHLDLPIDYDNLMSIGSMMGSGGMIVMDETDCMVDVAKFFLEFTVDESCGKCTPCRIGNLRLLEILEKITQGRGTDEDLETLKTLGETIKDTSLCGLGQSSPNPVLSTLHYFYDEYEAHVKEHKCPAGKCTALLKYEVIPEKCKACTLCAKVCPVNCIEGERGVVHNIDQQRCVKCGACIEKCPFDAIERR